MYRRVWWTVAVVVGVPAVVAAVVLAPPTLVVPVAGIGGLAGTGLALHAGRRYRVAALAGGLTAAATVAVVGLVYDLGTAGAVLAGVLAAASPLLVRRVLATVRAFPRFGGHARHSEEASQPTPAMTAGSEPPTASGAGALAHADEKTLVVPRSTVPEPSPFPAPATSPAPAQDLRALSDSELCFAWRHSYLTLQRAGLPLRCAEVVQARARYLDELERRHPAGFHAWLAHGARAASDPTRYLR